MILWSLKLLLTLLTYIHVGKAGFGIGLTIKKGVSAYPVNIRALLFVCLNPFFIFNLTKTIIQMDLY